MQYTNTQNEKKKQFYYKQSRFTWLKMGQRVTLYIRGPGTGPKGSISVYMNLSFSLVTNPSHVGHLRVCIMGNLAEFAEATKDKLI